MVSLGGGEVRDKIINGVDSKKSIHKHMYTVHTKMVYMYIVSVLN